MSNDSRCQDETRTKCAGPTHNPVFIKRPGIWRTGADQKGLELNRGSRRDMVSGQHTGQGFIAGGMIKPVHERVKGRNGG